MIREIYDNYHTPHPTNFSSPGNIKRYYGDKYSREEIVDTLQYNDAYTLHREYKEPKRNCFYVRRFLEQIQIDLIDIRSLSGDNDKNNWLFLAIDSFSKYIWVKPMKTKSAEATLASLTELVEVDLARKRIESIFTDRGKEFDNNLVKRYLRRKKIRLDLAMSETKAAIAERANRSLQV